jgi:hypothetical protein
MSCRQAATAVPTTNVAEAGAEEGPFTRPTFGRLTIDVTVDDPKACSAPFRRRVKID